MLPPEESSATNKSRTQADSHIPPPYENIFFLKYTQKPHALSNKYTFTVLKKPVEDAHRLKLDIDLEEDRIWPGWIEDPHVKAYSLQVLVNLAHLEETIALAWCAVYDVEHHKYMKYHNSSYNFIKQDLGRLMWYSEGFGNEEETRYYEDTMVRYKEMLTEENYSDVVYAWIVRFEHSWNVELCCDQYARAVLAGMPRLPAVRPAQVDKDCSISLGEDA